MLKDLRRQFRSALQEHVLSVRKELTDDVKSLSLGLQHVSGLTHDGKGTCESCQACQECVEVQIPTGQF